MSSAASRNDPLARRKIGAGRKFTTEDVLAIKADLERLSDRQIAKKYRIDQARIDAIAVGHHYGDVQPPRPPLPTRFHARAIARAGR